MAPNGIMDPSLDAVLQAARESLRRGGHRTAVVNGRRRRVPYPFPSPADWRDCPIYFVLIDRFNNPGQPPVARWDQVYDYRQGGNFKGIQAKLPYIADLGMQAIWLSPVVKNARPADWAWNYHGYGAQNFLVVDDRLGTEKDLQDLVTAAHALGLYVILDIVLNHSARVFDYVWQGRVTSSFDNAALLEAPLSVEPPVQWLNGLGFPRSDWQDLLPPAAQLSADDAVYPLELQNHLFFRRRGQKVSDEPGTQGFVKGDFGAMRQLVVEYDAGDPFQQPLRDQLGSHPVLTILVRAYQYLMARFDLDGYRLDTVKYVHPRMVQYFGNAMREFALSIGKRNFFTFGEIYDDEATIAAFVGRNGGDNEGFGIDAALDFPLHYQLPKVAKAMDGCRVESIRAIFEQRKAVEQELISSHGEAGRFFVSFLDNHDKTERFNHPRTPAQQVTLGIALLFALQGIPCLYYGTEQGLSGTTDDQGRPCLNAFESVREALWGKQRAFDRNHPLYRQIAKIAALRRSEAALRYGRLYFRKVSGNGRDFGYPAGQGGMLCFSRILSEREVLVVANTHPTAPFSGFVLLDRDLNRAQPKYAIHYSNRSTAGSTLAQQRKAYFWDKDVYQGSGPVAMLPVRLGAMEVQILAV